MGIIIDRAQSYVKYCFSKGKLGQYNFTNVYIEMRDDNVIDDQYN